VTANRLVKGNGRSPRFPVTSDRGNGASISLDLGTSETSPKRQERISADGVTQSPAVPPVFELQRTPSAHSAHTSHSGPVPPSAASTDSASRKPARFKRLLGIVEVR
jgi:hypothetical protein